MRVNLQRRGTGEPLVLFHGIGHRWQAWQPVMDQLAGYHEVIAVDLPGFGGSPVPPGGMPRDMRGVVDGVAGLFAAEGLRRPHVAGNSLGGAIALELAAAGLVRSATAFSPAGFTTEAERRRALVVLRAMRATTYLPAPLLRASLRVPAVRAASFGRLVAHPSRIDAATALGDAIAMRRGRGFAAVARAARAYRFEGRPTVPVTVGWGDRDRILRPHQADRARRQLPDARHVPMPGCGHVPMSDDPDLVAGLILQTTGARTEPLV